MNSPLKATYISVVVGAAVWCGALLLAPFLAASSGLLQVVGQYLYSFFQPICHQEVGRSFHLFGEALAVCHRCSAIYFAFLAGATLFHLVRRLYASDFPSRSFLIIAIAPMVLDVAAGILGLYEPTMMLRLFTGGLAGFILPFFIIPAAAEAWGSFRLDHQSHIHEESLKGESNA